MPTSPRTVPPYTSYCVCFASPCLVHRHQLRRAGVALACPKPGVLGQASGSGGLLSPARVQPPARSARGPQAHAPHLCERARRRSALGPRPGASAPRPQELDSSEAAPGGATAAAATRAAADRRTASARSPSAAPAGPQQPPEREQQLPGWSRHCPTRPRPRAEVSSGRPAQPSPAPPGPGPAPPSRPSSARPLKASGHLGAQPQGMARRAPPEGVYTCPAVPLVEEDAPMPLCRGCGCEAPVSPWS